MPIVTHTSHPNSNSPQLKQRIPTQHRPNKHPIRLQRMLDLRQRPDDIAHPMQAGTGYDGVDLLGGCQRGDARVGEQVRCGVLNTLDGVWGLVLRYCGTVGRSVDT